MTAAVVAGGVFVLPTLRGARPNPVKEQALLSLARSMEAQTGRGRSTSPSAPEASATPGTPRGKGRRIEELPAASPIAYRPLRVEELPEAPGGKRGRREKGAASANAMAGDPGTADNKAAPVAAAAASGGALRIEDLPSVSAAVRPLRNDELNPELVKRADDLLWNHPAPVGVDVPMEVNGKTYVARFAYHYHEFGGAKKPWGYHKGVTLYSTEK